MIVLSNISLALSDTSFDALNDPNQINFAYTLLDLHYAYDINFDTLGVEATASAWADIAVDFYANLTLPQTGFDAEITLGNGGFADQVIEVGDQVVFATRDYVFSGVTSSSFLDLSTLAFSTGFDVDVDAGISDITFDIPFGSDIVIDGLSIGTDGVQRFELLGFALDANAGEHFTSDVDPFEEALNDIPVESIMAGTYAVSQFPLDINWDFAALGFDETSQTLVPSIAGSSDFSVQNGSGDAFLEAVLDLDDLVAQYLLPGLSNPSNPLLSPFEFNWSSTIFEDTIWEVNPQLLATLLDLDLSIGVELVQQTSFDQTGTSVSVSQNGVDLATGELGDTLSFDGLQSEGTGVYDVTYGASGDLTTSYGIIFTMDVPVTLMDVAFWNGDLEFDVDGHGFTTPQVPDDAWNFTVYDNTFRIGQSGFIPIPGMDSVTAVEFVSGIEQFEVEFTEDAWRAVSSSDPDVVVQNPADGSGASCDIIGTNGNDSLVGDDCDNLIDAMAGRDTLIGGAGDDLLLVSYNSNAGDDADSVDGGAGTDRAVYTLGGYATLGNVYFTDAEGNGLDNVNDFDTVFDLSRDLTNFSQIGLYGGAYSFFSNVEAIDIDATGGTRSNSAGEFWYLGGTVYLGSTVGRYDRFIANWSDQTNAVEWDVRTAGAQDLANGVTVGYFERVYLALGGGDDTVTGAGNADHIEGGGGDDLLDGSGGNDTLIGGADNDFLNGGEGSDLLVGGVGDDILGGGFGNDTYQITVGDGADLILDPDGGSVNLDGFDFDAAEFSRDGSVLQIDFTGSTDSLRILNYFSQSGDWRFYFDGVARDLDVADLFHPWDSLGRIVTRVDGDNSTSWHLFGAGEFVLMNGGQDVVYAGVGADLIDGGSATDVVSYIDSDAAVTVDLATQTGAGGFAEGDRYIAVEAFQGSNHDDQFYGSSEGDIFSGELGNDILLGADGDDTLNGGAGDDTLTGGAGNDAVDGGEGYDVAVLAIYYDQVEIEFSDGGFIITSDLGADFYINVDSFQFADVVKSADEITSQDLADISGGAGDDTLTGTNQSEVISAESGNDFLRGLGGDDMLFGMAGDDRLYGQAGDDTLVGGAGDDRLEGGAGADHIDGGSGRDIVQYVTATRSVRVDLQNPAISYNDAAGDTFVDVEVFQTGNTIDQLRGDAGANEFYTGGLSDRLYGRAGNDLLFGEDGADAFYGGLGADIMTGGSQAGRMDRFIYFDIRESGVGAGNRDIITDFVTGEDRIELSRFDADVTQGLKQRFVFVGNAGLSGTAGELAYSYEGGNTIVQADTTGDGIANFEIELAGLLELSSGDFFI